MLLLLFFKHRHHSQLKQFEKHLLLFTTFELTKINNKSMFIVNKKSCSFGGIYIPIFRNKKSSC